MGSASLYLKNNAPSSDSAADKSTGFIMLLLLIMSPFLGCMGLCGCGWRRVLVGMILRKTWPPAQLRDLLHRGKRHHYAGIAACWKHCI